MCRRRMGLADQSRAAVFCPIILPSTWCFLVGLALCIGVAAFTPSTATSQEGRGHTDIDIVLQPAASIRYVGYRPTPSVAWQADSAVVLLDWYGKQIVVHTLGSDRRHRIGRQGRGPGEFRGAVDLAVTAAGEIYVTDPLNNRLSRFSADGAFLESYRLPGFSNSVVAGGGIVYVDWFSYERDALSEIGRVDTATKIGRAHV